VKYNTYKLKYTQLSVNNRCVHKMFPRSFFKHCTKKRLTRNCRENT